MSKRIRKVKKPRLRSPKRRGQGLMEYAMILSLVAVVVIVVLAILGPAVGSIFSTIVNYTMMESPSEEPGPSAPPECYGSLLLPLMVGSTGLAVGISTLLPKRAAPIPSA